jgi:uncharacterized protein YkwD
VGSRHVKAVLGAVIMAGTIIFSSAAVEPERAGAAITVRACGGGSVTLNDKEKHILMLHNKARTDRGLRPLCADPELTRAARSHSREMIEKDYFSHNSYDGERVGERLKRFGYDLGVYGENLAGGSGTSGTADATFQRWMNSPGHKANILDGRFRPVGVGTCTGNYKDIQEYTMYTVDFGIRR